MLPSLLTRLACPVCLGALGLHVHRELDSNEIDEGLLVCEACGRWFPIVGQLPELLPDHLRDGTRERELFARLGSSLPLALREACERFVPGGTAVDDAGAHHKTAEIGIRARIDNPEDFFGPGYSAPFNPHRTEFSLYLIHLFGAVAPLLECRHGSVVVDSGCGYSWTTEWLYRSGIEAIGVDICRAYLEIGIERMGPQRPHLIVADVEHLPLRTEFADAVLAYESFHHIPDRQRAMRGYARVLKPGGRVVLAEPGAAHEEAPVSVDTMAKYGILEKGMELSDVIAYVDGAPFEPPEQMFHVLARHGDLGRRLVEVARLNSLIDGNIFRIRKQGAQLAQEPAAESEDVDLAVLAADVPRLRAQLTGAMAELHDTQIALAQAKDRIFHMERSLFWKARGAWVAARAALRLPRRHDEAPGA